VEKLDLVTSIHPSPYALQWFSEDGELIVDKQVNITLQWLSLNRESVW